MLLVLVLSQAALAETCHIGFKLGQGTYTQSLKKRTVKRLGLKNYQADQFDPAKLTFRAVPKFDKRGRYKKCDIQKLRYAGERFSAFGTVFKKVAAGTGLFTLGLGTFWLTILALYADAEGDSKERKMSPMTEDQYKSLREKARSRRVVTTYHLHPSHVVYVERRRVYRTVSPYYNYHFMTYEDYVRVRTLEAGIYLSAFLIASAFSVPEGMDNTNQLSYAEKTISQDDCNVEAIKEKLVFDQYLYCGDFSSRAYDRFYENEEKVKTVVSKSLAALAEGNKKKFFRTVNEETKARYSNNTAFQALREQMSGARAYNLEKGEIFKGSIPGEKKLVQDLKIGEIRLLVECDQKWAYDKQELKILKNEFVPVNQLKSCKLAL